MICRIKIVLQRPQVDSYDIYFVIFLANNTFETYQSLIDHEAQTPQFYSPPILVSDKILSMTLLAPYNSFKRFSPILWVMEQSRWVFYIEIFLLDFLTHLKYFVSCLLQFCRAFHDIDLTVNTIFLFLSRFIKSTKLEGFWGEHLNFVHW